MRYRVRTPDGELDYTSMGEVERAYIQGLVGPEDEVREEGQTLWRKASTIPVLARAKPPPKAWSFTSLEMGIILSVVRGFSSLMLLLGASPVQRGLGLLLALSTAMMLSRVTYKAFRRPGAPKR